MAVFRAAFSCLAPQRSPSKKKIDRIGDLGLEDRCIGTLLGVIVGDQLGAGVEGMDRKALEEKFPQGLVRDFCYPERSMNGKPPPKEYRYTDDTEMTVALAESILSNGKVDGTAASAAFARAYHEDRGYGKTARNIMVDLKKGADWRRSGEKYFTGGSFGNGSVMRISPVGVAYRNASRATLSQAVSEACWCTHTHPVAIDAALVQAAAVAYLVKKPEVDEFDPTEFLKCLESWASTAELKEKMEYLRNNLAKLHDTSNGADTLETIATSVDDIDVLTGFGGDGFQIKADVALATSLWGFIRYWRSPEECLVRVCSYGGDTDTIASISGALVGALHGTDWIPLRWFKMLENTARGRDHIIQLGRRLSRLDCIPEPALLGKGKGKTKSVDQ